MNPQLNIFKGQPRHELRVDWLMRQFVDGIKERLAQGEDPDTLATEMKERGVPYHVAARVLVQR